MVEIVEVNDIEELAQYRMLWNSLFPGTPNATFFHTFDWLDTYWRHFGHDQKLRVLIVYAAGEPLGILPLCVRTEPYRLSKVRVLTYPLDNWSTWYGPIGPNPASTMLAAMQHLRRTPRDWDMMELRWVADEDTQGGKSARAMRVAGMFSEKQEYQWTSLVDIPASWDEYLASKSPSLRRQFRRTIRDFFADGSGRIHSPPAAVRPPKATAIRVGTCTPSAKRSPTRVGSRTSRTATRSRTNAFANTSARRTPWRPAWECST